MDAEAALWARGRDSRWAKGSWGSRRLYPCPHLGRRRLGKAARRRQVAAGPGAWRGGAAWRGRGLEAAVEVVGMLGDEVAYL